MEIIIGNSFTQEILHIINDFFATIINVGKKIYIILCLYSLSIVITFSV